jgi:hypothetical protein
VCAIFGTLLGALFVGLLLWQSDPLPTGLLGGASALSYVTAVGLAIDARRPRKAVRADPDLSFGAVALAFGIAGLIVGAELGTWVLLLSGGITLGGLVQLLRESRDARRAERVARAS